MKFMRQSPTLAGLLLLSFLALPVWAGAGHDHGKEFETGSGTIGEVKVDTATAQRLDLRVESVQSRPLAVGIQVTGQIEALPNRQVEVTTPAGGTLVRLLVKPGDRVTAGQPLAQMTSPDLADLRSTAQDRRTEAVAKLQQAQADLLLAQETYQRQQQQAAADIQQAQTEVSVTQERYSRDRELLDKGAIPRRQVQESETLLAAAKAALVKAQGRLGVAEAQAQLRRAQSQVQSAQSQLALSDSAYQTRLRQLGTTANANGTITITAPITGIVADQDTTPGESGQDAGKPILTLVNLERVQITANIYEKDLNQVRLGQTLQLQVASLPQRRFTATVRSIGSVMAGETRVIPVRAELENPGELLRPGMFANLDLFTNRTAGAVMVIPETAIITTQDQRQIVFVQNGDRFAPTEVSLGRREGAFVEVTEGLFAGDRVVTQRANQLYSQSLRGGGEEEPGHNDNTEGKPTANGLSLPWWLALPAGMGLAGGMFWFGSRWGSGRQVQPAPLNFAAMPGLSSAQSPVEPSPSRVGSVRTESLPSEDNPPVHKSQP